MSNLKYAVLVVDDTESNIDILVDLLSKDYDVSVAMDGPSALEIAAATPFNIILLDIVMPGMDGFEVCKKLKSDPKTKDCPVVFVSANSTEEDKKKGYSLGAVNFISKPFKPSEVIQVVGKFIKK